MCRHYAEDKINSITVRQLGKLAGTVEAYSAGLLKVSVVNKAEEQPPEESMLGSWVASGSLGQLRENCGVWGADWKCSHWEKEAEERKRKAEEAEKEGEEVEGGDKAAAGEAGAPGKAEEEDGEATKKDGDAAAAAAPAGKESQNGGSS